MAEHRLTNENIIQLYERDGETLREIGRKAGLSHEKVRKILIAAGVHLRPPIQRNREIPREELVRLHFELGLGIMEIAERYGIHRATLLGIMRRHGIEPRRYSRRPGIEPRKYPPLPELRVGESVEIELPPRPAGSGAHRVRYHQMAKEAGIRVSLQTINGGNALRVTRIQPDAHPEGEVLGTA
jgi:transposase-like protein